MAKYPGEYTFYPEFGEYIPLYRGIVRVWLGDGSTGKAGNLYAEYIDGAIQDLGPVTSFAYAAREGIAGPGTPYPTEEDWINYLANAYSHILDAEAWANGTRGGQPIQPGDEVENKFSKYWAEQSKSYSDGKSLDDSTDIRATDNAEYYKNLSKKWAVNSTKVEGNLDSAKTYAENSKAQADRSAMWASGTSSGDGAIDNNAKHWAEQSKEFANGKDLNGNLVKPDDNAEYFKDQSKLWAIGPNDPSSTPSDTNNAEYYAYQADLQRQGAETAFRNASDAARAAEEFKLQAESWTKGTRNGQPDTSGVHPGAAEDNASYYSDQANWWADESRDSCIDARGWATYKAGDYSNTNNAQYHSETSESWAVGKRAGADVPRSDAAYENNSKYYASKARKYTEGKDLDGNDDQQYVKANAKHYAEQSSDHAETAKEWATKDEDLGPVEGQLYSSKTYAERAEISRGRAESYRDDAYMYMEDAAFYRTLAEGFANGEHGGAPGHEGTPVPEGDVAYHNNAKYWSQEAQRIVNEEAVNLEIAQQWANGTTSETYQQGMSSKDQAEQSAAKALKSEGYAVGTQNDAPVQPGSPYYENNAQYYMGQAHSWATYNAGSPSNTNNAQYYAETAEAWAKGTRNDVAIGVSDPAYGKDAKEWANKTAITYSGTDVDGRYHPEMQGKTVIDYSNKAKDWASKDGSSPVADGFYSARAYAVQAENHAEDASNYSGSAHGYAQDAQAWAEGKIDDEPLPPSSPAYHNNSKYWANMAEQIISQEALALRVAQEWANGTIDQQYQPGMSSKEQANRAYNEAERAYTQAENVHTDVLKAEGYAVGTQDGSDVQSGSPYYNNNAKYYNGSAQAAAASSAASSLESHEYKTDSEAWAVGKRDGHDVSSSDETYNNNAKYYAEEASDAVTSISTIAETVHADAEAAEDAKDEAALWATGNTSGTPSSTNNSKYFAEYMDQKIAEFGDIVQGGVTEYQNSNSGTVCPTGTWASDPYPEEGKFLWSKTTFQWGGGQTTILYNVSHIGANGTGSVGSVNGLGGQVILDGSNINVDNSAASPKPILRYAEEVDAHLATIDGALTSITDAEINALFD